jgi:hypothetical protein
MPCLETVLIHTGSGVPLYLKTYAGHVPLVKNVLPLLLAATWRVLDTSGAHAIVTLASGWRRHLETCADRGLWTRLEKRYAG